MSRCSGYGYDCGDSSMHPERLYAEPDKPICFECDAEYADEESGLCEDCWNGGKDE